jgi:hypothetical protein
MGDRLSPDASGCNMSRGRTLRDGIVLALMDKIEYYVTSIH